MTVHMTTYAWNYRDRRWHQVAIVSYHTLDTVKVEWLEGPEHEARDIIGREYVEYATERPTHDPRPEAA